MFFALSKIFWWIAAPLNALVLALLIGTCLLWTRWRRAGKWLLTAAIVPLVLLGFTRLSDLPLIWLESRYEVPDLTDPPRGIIVLGGGISVSDYHHDAPYYLGSWADRITVALALKRQYPQARLIYSGGSGSLTDPGGSEAESARIFIRSLYGDDLGIEMEEESRNTWENGVNTIAMIPPAEQDRPWLLVTSAWHMSRAMGVFRQLGMTPIPYPTDYKAARLASPWLANSAVDQFEKLSIALREFIGIAAYRATGRWQVAD